MPLDTAPIDTIVVGANIITMQAPGHRAEALAIAGGRIAALGPTAEIRALAPGARAIDCAGATVLPGLIDSHCHPDMLGARIGRWCDLGAAAPADRAALLATLGATAAALPAGAWVLAYNFDDTRMGGYPSRAELDAASGGRPAFLYRRDALMGVANSAGLAALGFTAGAADPPHGRIERDAFGAPTGLLRARAAHLLIEHVQRGYTEDDFHAGLGRVLAGYSAAGVTSLHNSLATSQGIGAYQRLRAEGALDVRIGLIASGREPELIAGLIRSGLRSGFGDAWIRLIGVEWVADGSTSGRTAAWRAPYRPPLAAGEGPGHRGELLFGFEELLALALPAHRAGLTVCLDGMGDRGVEFTLDIIEALLEDTPRADHRMRVEHCCAVPPDLVARLARLGVVASSASGFAHDLGDAHLAARGPAEMKHLWPLRALIDAGVPAPCHSDNPVCDVNPFRGMAALVNRRTSGGADLDASQAITVHEALETYTRLGAWAGREERLKGDLSPGKLADLCVLDRDPFAAPPQELGETGVIATLVGGRVVHDARGLA
ncbi:amidohydrolase (plasmid) [Paroceanicella profunda]|uniref:Amidohydrolase n=1 Tax=Paroceanicella profunda TaxID=2579971 RepID=A0A5B8G3P5_9RHOB|nr:amidohydrolase [Paroceanicella profunda]QDL94600.1 amidohydrolase [Paroceanicella profunda]